MEKNLCRFWFRKNPEVDIWKTHGFNYDKSCDKSAAVLKTICVEKAAETYREVIKNLNLSIPEVKEDPIKLLNDVYIKDGSTGGTRRDVEGMIGVKLDDGIS